MPCTADLERRDYLDFLPKRPQGTTKILGTPAFAGTKTPAVLKFSSKGATTDCAETPVNCPYISGLRAARTAGGWPTKHLPAGRRAGRSGGCGDACDAMPLSCFASSQAPHPSLPPKRAKNRSLRRSSFSHRTRFAGLRRGPHIFSLQPGGSPPVGAAALGGPYGWQQTVIFVGAAPHGRPRAAESGGSYG